MKITKEVFFKIIQFINQLIKDHKEELKEILWDLLLTIVKMARENRIKTTKV